MKNNEERFLIPHMVLTREDVEQCTDIEDATTITDEEMIRIAQRMSDAFMQDWSLVTDICTREVVRGRNNG